MLGIGKWDLLKSNGTLQSIRPANSVIREASFGRLARMILELLNPLVVLHDVHLLRQAKQINHDPACSFPSASAFSEPLKSIEPKPFPAAVLQNTRISTKRIRMGTAVSENVSASFANNITYFEHHVSGKYPHKHFHAV